MWLLSLLSIVISIVATMIVMSSPMTYYNRAKKQFHALAKAFGIGYLVYHSNDQKHYYALTYKQAMVKLGCTYADAALFSNWSKQALAVVQRKQCVQFS